MAGKKIADLVYKTPSGAYRTVGGLTQADNNDPAKGPGFQIVLDRHFSPAGCADDGTGSVWLSTYHAKGAPFPPMTDTPTPRAPYPPPAVRRPPGDLDDDIPF